MKRLLMTTALVFAGSTSLVLAQETTDPEATVAPVEESNPEVLADDGMIDDGMTDDSMAADTTTESSATTETESDDNVTVITTDTDVNADTTAVVDLPNPMVDMPGWIEPEGFVRYTGAALTADILLNANVYDVQNNSVSSLSDFVMDDEGAITHAIIDVGGFLGIGERSVAIPFEDLVIYREVNMMMTDDGAVMNDGMVNDGLVEDDGLVGDDVVEVDPNTGIPNENLRAGDLRIYLPMTEEQLEELPEVDL